MAHSLLMIVLAPSVPDMSKTFLIHNFRIIKVYNSSGNEKHNYIFIRNKQRHCIDNYVWVYSNQPIQIGYKSSLQPLSSFAFDNNLQDTFTTKTIK